MATNNSMLQSTFPVDLPAFDELTLPKAQFDAYVKTLVIKNDAKAIEDAAKKLENADIKSVADVDAVKCAAEMKQDQEKSGFMLGLLSEEASVPSLDDRDGKMLTENGDVAYRDSGSALVDLFHEMEDVIAGARLQTVLENAWRADSDATLKLIWNARSIHLGKSSRTTFYRAVGWLYQNHPATLMANLSWLVRPLISKKAPKKREQESTDGTEAIEIDEKDADSDFELIDEPSTNDSAAVSRKRKLDELERDDDEFDIKYGVSHGYWKDLLNILALAANDELKVDGNSHKVLTVDKPVEKAHNRDWTQGRKKSVNKQRHQRTLEKLGNEPLYKALHLTVARLFADQLRLDLARLDSGDKNEIKKVTLAGKWAPSNKGMHDQHTTIVTSIAELLHPFDTVCPKADPGDRTLYIKHARNAYQIQTLSKLRKHIQIVERPISAGQFEQIKYERVPSLAMKQYTSLFAKKDFDRFDKYIDKVVQGQARISGATLLPSTLVAEVSGRFRARQGNRKSKNALVDEKLREIRLKSLGGQWDTLVQRIKDSGTLESSIAVCDVSGSMGGPNFPDGTCPMDSSIGLALLIAEVTAPPFGGAFITFHERPQVLQVGGPDDKRSFAEKVAYIEHTDWGCTTNFVAVFEDLILPMAVKNKLKPEEMVKQIFCFSDMQFDAADLRNDRWTSSFERIQKKFKEHGYEVPKLIFWNLAGGRGGYDASNIGNGIATKPVGADEVNTALVSGYSQAQLKMFLEKGQFDDAEEQEVVETKETGEDGETVMVEKKKKVKKMAETPLTMMRKAISHDAYQMLKVVD